MKTNSIGKSFTIEEILKINFQNFHISWKGSKSISWTFLGSLHNETIMKYAFHEMPWKKHFTVYPCLKKCQTFTIEKNWCSQDFDFLRKKFEESYIRGNVYFDIIAFNCLSSAKPCLRFLLICFAREIKDIYQSFLGNEVYFRDTMNVSPNIFPKNQDSKKLRHGFIHKKQWLQRHWYLPVIGKSFYFLLEKEKTWKRIFNINSELWHCMKITYVSVSWKCHIFWTFLQTNM